jgi:hypothetical protein
MAETIIDSLRYHGGKQPLTKQTIPPHEELLAFPGEETGDTLETRPGGYDPLRDALPEGRDSRLYSLDSPGRCTWVTYIPDAHGFYVEDFKGTRYRPEDLDELKALLEEMDHQIGRYGGLL